MNRNKLAKEILKDLCESFRDSNGERTYYEHSFLSEHFDEYSNEEYFVSAVEILSKKELVKYEVSDANVEYIELSENLINKLEENKFLSATKNVYEIIKLIAPFL